MTKKISLELPEKDYEELSSLGKLYNKDVSQVILDVINAVMSSLQNAKQLSPDDRIKSDIALFVKLAQEGVNKKNV